MWRKGRQDFLERTKRIQEATSSGQRNPYPTTTMGTQRKMGASNLLNPEKRSGRKPFPLPKDFEWSVLDILEPSQLKEVYELLSANYVEDEQAAFRFRYTAEFLQWAFMPPGWKKEWHVGVRVSSNKKLVAFISGVPMHIRVRKKDIRAVEINYLCVHKKLRSKRLTPVLIKEITRRCHLEGIFQAIYTGGVVIPTPISTCRYYHRTLNVPKLVDAKFTYVPRNMTIARMVRQFKPPSTLALSRSGLREMEDSDVPAVTELFRTYMARFDMVPLLEEEDVRHQFLSGRGKGERVAPTGRRQGQVVWTYVVENPESHAITDFFSFYTLPSTVVSNPRHDILEAAYLYYYATDTAFVENAEEHGLLKRRLMELIGDAIVLADQAKFDVFNALTLMDNPMFLQDLKVTWPYRKWFLILLVDDLARAQFGSGDGLLNFYLYNWRSKGLAGMNPTADRVTGRGVGVVML
ncbi:Myristoyl-CoA:protein N-myristoyltransferase, N-terminal domain-containing protein [Russula emetica]|nr:Myristoyl-CoA:protein N-myristoyltransferase, N-terminal domain-containing protein [Russula emetica]